MKSVKVYKDAGRAGEKYTQKPGSTLKESNAHKEKA